MEETIQNQPITPPTPIETAKPKSQFGIFLAILLTAIVTGALVFWWQSRIYQSTITQLQSQIDSSQNQHSQASSTTTGVNTPPQPTTIPTQSTDLTADWQNHTDYTNAFAIKYPKGWRKVDFGNGSIGVGPAEVGEDVKWAVNIYDPSATTIESIISDMGDQFDDRQEKREDVVIWAGGDNIKATKVTVTTSQYSDWQYEAVIFEHYGKIFSISNGAIIDSDFELFYNSFTRLG